MMTRRILVMATLLAAAGCGQSPTSPRSVSLPLPTGNTGTPPIIRSITVPTARREAGVDIPITAVIENTNEQPHVLSLEWAANVGTITGTGTTAIFRHPLGITKGVDVVITLTVVKRYTKGGGAFELRVSQQAAAFRVHDSVAELKELGRRFLMDLFGRSEISPIACLVDFSENGPCKAGRDSELEDLINHRRDYVVLDRRMNSQSVFFTGPDSARIDNNAWFMDRRIATGFVGTTEGNFPLTAVYESSRWWLCSSGFDDDLLGDGGIARIKRSRGRLVIRK
jgi:hypothetical protein